MIIVSAFVAVLWIAFAVAIVLPRAVAVAIIVIVVSIVASRQESAVWLLE